MIMRARCFFGLLLSGLVAAGFGTIACLGGCGLTQPFPRKNLYAIDAGRPATAPVTAPTTSPAALTIRIAPVRIAQPFDGQTFVYKLSAGQYKIDYYNGFIAPPDRLIAGQLVSWLSGSGAVKYAVPSGSGLDCDYSLETNVTALYCDYSRAGPPRAVVAIRCFLIADSGGSARLVMQKQYQKEEPLSADTPDQLAAAFGRAWREILAQLAGDLTEAH